MTTPLRQFILKRGNTTVSSTYTGPVGEITYDTGFNAVRIHDGITPGGNLMPSNGLITAVSSNVTILQANVSTLFANAATQAVFISTLQSNVATLSNLASSSGSAPPAIAAAGALWYDTVDGRLYVYYSGSWVDASPESIYTLPVATDTVLGGVKIGDNLAIDGAGVLSALPPTNLGNLTVNDQTINGTVANRDITLTPLGTGTVRVPSVTLPVGSIIQSTDVIDVPLADLTLDTVVDYSTGAGDSLLPGTIGNPTGIAHPWAIYRFTTTPSPVLAVGDVIGGAAVPINSTVVYVGTDAYSAYAVTNKVFPLGVPTNGTTLTFVRPTVNASLALTTQIDTDIALVPGGGAGGYSLSCGGGGGGGGILSVGGDGALSTAGGVGGGPLGGAAPATVGLDSTYGGGSGSLGSTSTGYKGGSSYYGGGGGGGGLDAAGNGNNDGGDSIYGGGGGGGAFITAGTASLGGTSVFGGAGSNGTVNGAASAAGTAPAGGSGGTEGGGSGAGGSGRVQFTYW